MKQIIYRLTEEKKLKFEILLKRKYLETREDKYKSTQAFIENLINDFIKQES